MANCQAKNKKPEERVTNPLRLSLQAMPMMRVPPLSSKPVKYINQLNFSASYQDIAQSLSKDLNACCCTFSEIL